MYVLVVGYHRPIPRGLYQTLKEAKQGLIDLINKYIPTFQKHWEENYTEYDNPNPVVPSFEDFIFEEEDWNESFEYVSIDEIYPGEIYNFADGDSYYNWFPPMLHDLLTKISKCEYFEDFEDHEHDLALILKNKHGDKYECWCHKDYYRCGIFV